MNITNKSENRNNSNKSIPSAMKVKNYFTDKLSKDKKDRSSSSKKIYDLPIDEDEERNDKIISQNSSAMSHSSMPIPRIPNDEEDNMSVTSFHTARSVGVTKNEDKLETVKIYLLLLELKTKKFEINQISIPSKSNVLTIGDILLLIPTKASDVIIAQQRYRGICRPTNGIEMANLSACAMDDDGHRIQNGEILVPIPHGYSGMECMKASQHILKLPMVENMFQQLNSTVTKKNNRHISDRISLNKVEEVASPHSDKSQFDFSNNKLHSNDESSPVKEKFPVKKKLIYKRLHSLETWNKFKWQFFRYRQKLKRSPLVTKIITTLIVCYIFRIIVFSNISGTKSTFIVGSFEVFIFFSFLVWIQKKDIKKVKRKLVYGQ